jgi:nanoRNase/pAp phosphatase (c-di-AMP/oligoRNAs hydrolase)
VKFSLRASEDSNFNVARLAEKFGGGGHAKAAGFTIPKQHLFALLEGPEFGEKHDS